MILNSGVKDPLRFFSSTPSNKSLLTPIYYQKSLSIETLKDCKHNLLTVFDRLYVAIPNEIVNFTVLSLSYTTLQFSVTIEVLSYLLSKVIEDYWSWMFLGCCTTVRT